MSEPTPIYLDHAASTPMRPEAIAAMAEWLADPANPSGGHRQARAARRAIDDARDRVAALVGARPSEVVFTSGGTESDNAAVFGSVDAAVAGVRAGVPAAGGAAVVARCTAVEHPSVLEAVRRVSIRAGEPGDPTLAVGPDGRVDLDAAAEQLSRDVADGRRVAIVSAMLANNEVGVIQPVVALAGVVRGVAPDALMHTDAVQATAWIDLRETWEHVDLLSMSAHKFGGPKGIGALVVRAGSAWQPQQIGGSQEAGRRSGTPSVASIVAMGVAADLTARDRDREATRIAALRDRLADAIARRCPGVVETRDLTPSRPPTLPSIAHILVPGVDSEALLFLLERSGMAASAASSCASGAHRHSHVLDAMAVDRELSRGALRLSLGVTTTEAEVDAAAAVVGAAVERLTARATAP